MSQFARSVFTRWRALSPASQFLFGASSGLAAYRVWNRRQQHSDSSSHSPNSDSTDPSKQKVVLGSETLLNPHKGVSRVDQAQLIFDGEPEKSKNGIRSLRTKGTPWFALAIFDGSIGREASSFLRNSFLDLMGGALSEILKEDNKSNRTSLIEEAMRGLYVAADGLITHETVEALQKAYSSGTHREKFIFAATEVVAVARAASGALLGVFDADEKKLYVANVGEARAVLGRPRKTARGKTIYDIHVLSVDHTLDNPDEVTRLLAAHPNEPDLLRELFAADPERRTTRAFGDARMKWSRERQKWLHETALSDAPSDECRTPPYITVEPSMTTIDIQSGDVLVMASHGLFECLTNEEVVGLVGVWLEEGHADKPILSNKQPTPAPEQTEQTEPLPIEAVDAPTRMTLPELLLTIKPVERVDLAVTLTENKTHYSKWPAFKKRFVCTTFPNSAVHLIQNALGGAHGELLALNLANGLRGNAQVRDDISMHVVFFE
uniref:PPM-type phosphatase domain-containing protein n=1 Tax=Mycena chlorophos TaxID=658473 RepID=A0ABQ0LPE8_MYCCL|nr:predicted protein [Mycena chlorophos]